MFLSKKQPFKTKRGFSLYATFILRLLFPNYFQTLPTEEAHICTGFGVLWENNPNVQRRDELFCSVLFKVSETWGNVTYMLLRGCHRGKRTLMHQICRRCDLRPALSTLRHLKSAPKASLIITWERAPLISAGGPIKPPNSSASSLHARLPQPSGSGKTKQEQFKIRALLATFLQNIGGGGGACLLKSALGLVG